MSANRTKDRFTLYLLNGSTNGWKVRQIQLHKKRASANFIFLSFANSMEQQRNTHNNNPGKIYYLILMIIQYILF